MSSVPQDPWRRALEVAEMARRHCGLTHEQLGIALLRFLRSEDQEAFEDALVGCGFISGEQCAHLVGQQAFTCQGQRHASGDTIVDQHPRGIPDGVMADVRSSALQALQDGTAEAPQSLGRGAEEIAEVASHRKGGARPAEKYQTVRMLGRGGMGEVYEVRDVDLRRHVALKRIRTDHGDPGLLARFLEEAQVTAQLEHPGIIPIYDIGVLGDGRPYFTMKRVEGLTLAEVLASAARGDREALEMLDYRRRVITFLKVVQAVAYAHARGVVHCDLKPANILVGKYGEVLIVDWGLAQCLDAPIQPSVSLQPVDVSVTASSAWRYTAGTPPYMAPEQLRGEGIDPRTDIYALGAILYEMLTLQPAYEVDSLEALGEAQKHPPIPPRQRAPYARISEEIEQVTLRAMALTCDARYATAEELAEVLENHLTGARRRNLAEDKYAQARQAHAHFAALSQQRQDLKEELKKLAQRVKPYDGETKKAALWEAEEELARLELDAEAALQETLDGYGQAAGLDASLLAAADALADLRLELFLAAEARGDTRKAATHRRQVERYHRDRHVTVLEGRGLLTLHVAAQDYGVKGHPFLAQSKKLVVGPDLDLADGTLENLSLPMGSYLFRVTAPGKAPCHLAVNLGRGRKLELAVTLYDEKLVGEGFVHIPAGPFFYGGDPAALNSGPREELVSDDFFMARYPVTNQDYLEFINDLARTDPHRAQRHVPRTHPDGGFLWESKDGRFALSRCDAEGNAILPDGPVMGISFVDAETYADWRSQREGVAYRLPSEQEWEKAARGADGRFFPWGNGFDPTFCKMSHSRPGWPSPEPVGAFPSDISVYGVRDCAGTVREWCDSFFEQGNEPRVLRGGTWSAGPMPCRAAFRYGCLPHLVFANTGFRLCKSPPLVRRRRHAR